MIRLSIMIILVVILIFLAFVLIGDSANDTIYYRVLLRIDKSILIFNMRKKYIYDL